MTLKSHWQRKSHNENVMRNVASENTGIVAIERKTAIMKDATEIKTPKTTARDMDTGDIVMMMVTSTDTSDRDETIMIPDPEPDRDTVTSAILTSRVMQRRICRSQMTKKPLPILQSLWSGIHG